MNTKAVFLSGFIFSILVLGIGGSYKGCTSAADAEVGYNIRVQTRAGQWVAHQPQMQLAPDSIMCVPRSFGSRWISDPTSCRALTAANYRVALLCNMQGCALDHSNYAF